MTESFYVPDGDARFISTPRTIGPWGTNSQHGGPPAALLGRAIERTGDRHDLQVASITFDILKPVPIAPLNVATRVVRPGKNVELVEASLASDDRELMRAKAWRIRTADIDLADAPRLDPPPPPAQGRSFDLFPDGEINYLTSMENRFVAGSFIEPGPATAWFRPLFPLVEGEEISPLGRVLIAVDSASGISGVLDWGEWLYINPDLTVHLHRIPAGEWIGMDAVTYAEPHGIGLATSVIHDEAGSIGRSLQSLYVAPL